MHNVKIPAIVFFILVTFWGTAAESFWKIKTESGEEILLSVDVNLSTKTFKASTRREAIKEIAGFFAYNLAHAAGKLKYPEIVYIEGKANPVNDSLKLLGSFYYTDKKYDFQATIFGNSFRGKYTDNKNRVHSLDGLKQPDARPVKNYQALLNKAVACSEDYLPNPDWIKSGEWKDFKEAVAELKSKISDDYELGALVMWYSRKFPFAPFDISLVKSEDQRREKAKPQLQVPKAHVGLLHGSQLPWNQKQADSLAAAISRQAVTKLIIDLRGKTMVSPVQAKYLMGLLSQNEHFAGAFLTRKWGTATVAKSVPEFRKRLKNLPEADHLLRFQEVPGYTLEVTRSIQRFTGEVYVLTDSRTSRMAEILAGILQKEKLAKIAGQKTSAHPYVSDTFLVCEGFGLQLPVALFFDSEGRNSFRSGITPDISAGNENALNLLLKTVL